MKTKTHKQRAWAVIGRKHLKDRIIAIELEKPRRLVTVGDYPHVEVEICWSSKRKEGK